MIRALNGWAHVLELALLLALLLITRAHARHREHRRLLLLKDLADHVLRQDTTHPLDPDAPPPHARPRR